MKMAYNYEYPYTDPNRYNSDWLLNTVKRLTEEWLEVRKDWNNEQEEYKTLKDFINSYFDNLDVQVEINKKLDEMLNAGELDNILPTIKRKQVILITDSYGTHYGFMDMFRQATNFERLYPFTYSGGGFFGNGEAIPFIEALARVGIGITSKESITDIVVIGGFNDATDMINNGRSVDALSNKVAEFLIECSNTYPNALVHIGMAGWCSNITNGNNYRRTLKRSIAQAYRNGNYVAGKNNATYIENLEYAIHGFDCIDSTKYHPNEKGNKNIIRGIINSLYGGSCNYWFAGDCAVSLADGIEATLPKITLTQIMDNNLCCLYSASQAFASAITFPTALSVSPNTSIYLLKLESYIGLPFSNQYCDADVWYVDDTDGVTKSLDAVVFITPDGKIGFSRKHGSSGNIQVRAINIGSINFQFSTT